MAALGKEVPAAHEQLCCLPSLFREGLSPVVHVHQSCAASTAGAWYSSAHALWCLLR